MTGLTVLPPPISGESAAGFLMRAFAANGRDWSPHALRADGFSAPDILAGEVEAPLRHYAGIALAESGLVAPQIIGARVVIGREKLHRRDYTTRLRRWCPCCWQDDRRRTEARRPHWNLHRRVLWDIAPVETCPVHRVRLATSCPQCGEEVRWDGGGLVRCRHGHSLFDAPAVSIPEGRGGADAWLFTRLSGASAISVGPLDQEPLVDAITFMERVGAAWIDADARVPSLRAAVGRGTLMDAGHAVFAGWPDKGTELLDRVFAGGAKRAGRWGMARAYGGLYQWTSSLRAGPAADALRGLMAQHASSRVILKTGFNLGGGDGSFPMARLTLSEAAKVCGISFERMRRIAVARGLIADVRMKGMPAFLTPADVDTVARDLAGAVTLEAVAIELGIAQAAVLKLARAGHMPTIVPRAGPQGPCAWLFPSKAVIDLLTRIRAACSEGGSHRDLSGLGDAARAASCSVADVIGAVLEGRVAAWAAPRGEGLARFQVDRSEVEYAFRSLSTPGLTPAEFADRVGIPRPSVWQLADAGIVQAVVRNRRMFIADAEVARFRNEYVTVAEVRATRGAKAAVLVLRALDAGTLKPVCRRPDFRKLLFSRRAVETVLSKDGEGDVASDRDEGMVMTVRGAAARLGVDRRLIRDLVGLSSPAGARPRRASIVEGDLDRLRDAFVSGAELAGLLGKRNATSVYSVLRAAGIEPVHTLPDGASPVFDRRDAVAAIEAYRRELLARSQPRTGTVSATSAARLLGVSDQLVAQLVRADALTASRLGRFVVIEAASIVSFREAYAYGREIDELLNVKIGAGVRLLLKSGARPVFARPKLSAYVFRRCDVESVAKSPKA